MVEPVLNDKDIRQLPTKISSSIRSNIDKSPGDKKEYDLFTLKNGLEVLLIQESGFIDDL